MNIMFDFYGLVYPIFVDYYKIDISNITSFFFFWVIYPIFIDYYKIDIS